MDIGIPQISSPVDSVLGDLKCFVEGDHDICIGWWDGSVVLYCKKVGAVKLRWLVLWSGRWFRMVVAVDCLHDNDRSGRYCVPRWSRQYLSVHGAARSGINELNCRCGIPWFEQTFLCGLIEKTNNVLVQDLTMCCSRCMRRRSALSELASSRGPDDKARC